MVIIFVCIDFDWWVVLDKLVILFDEIFVEV